MRKNKNPIIVLLILSLLVSIYSQQVSILDNNNLGLQINCDDPEDNCPGARQLVLDGVAAALRAQCPECNFEQMQTLREMVVPAAAAVPAVGNPIPRPNGRNILSVLFQNLMKAQKFITSRYSRSRGQQSQPGGSRRSRQQQRQQQRPRPNSNRMQSMASGFRERLSKILKNIFSRRGNGNGQQRQPRGRSSRRADAQTQQATPKPMQQMTRMTSKFLQQLKKSAGAFILGAWKRVAAGRSGAGGARRNQNQQSANGAPKRKITVTL